ncbi:hypothetical protein LTR75_007527 [Friedmanniomyces endolithicus]|nr:hypothetical protein LTR75_007527 [Friedmanniomyces endolithicus]
MKLMQTHPRHNIHRSYVKPTLSSALHTETSTAVTTTVATTTAATTTAAANPVATLKNCAAMADTQDSPQRPSSAHTSPAHHDTSPAQSRLLALPRELRNTIIGSCLAGAYSQRIFTHGEPCQPFDAIFSSTQRVTIAPTRQTGLHLVNRQLYDEVREECVALPAQRLPDRHIYNFNDYPPAGGAALSEALNQIKSGADTDLVFWQPVPSYDTMGQSQPPRYQPISVCLGPAGLLADNEGAHHHLFRGSLRVPSPEPLARVARRRQILRLQQRPHPARAAISRLRRRRAPGASPDLPGQKAPPRMRAHSRSRVHARIVTHRGNPLEPSMHHRAVAQRSLQPNTEAITRREADALAWELGWTGPTDWQMRLRVAVLWWRRMVGRRAIAVVQPDAEGIARLKTESMSRQLAGILPSCWQIRLRMAVPWWRRDVGRRATALLHAVLLVMAISAWYRISEGKEVGER